MGALVGGEYCLEGEAQYGSTAAQTWLIKVFSEENYETTRQLYQDDRYTDEEKTDLMHILLKYKEEHDGPVEEGAKCFGDDNEGAVMFII